MDNNNVNEHDMYLFVKVSRTFGLAFHNVGVRLSIFLSFKLMSTSWVELQVEYVNFRVYFRLTSLLRIKVKSVNVLNLLTKYVKSFETPRSCNY